jgi:hypothetical protein
MDLVLRELAESLVESSGASQAFGLHVIPSTDPAAELARSIEREVFGDVFGNSAEVLDAEYRRYEPASVFLCVLDHRRLVPAGVMRLIVSSAHGLKSVDDIERVWGQRIDEVVDRTGCEFDRNSCWDIATLAVSKGYRRAAAEGLSSAALYQASVMIARVCRVRWYVAVLDVRVLRLISLTMGRPFSRFDGLEPAPYLDSAASLPVFIDLAAYEARVAADKPDIHDLLFEGHGLETAMWTPDWDDAAHRALDALGLTAQSSAASAQR